MQTGLSKWRRSCMDCGLAPTRHGRPTPADWVYYPALNTCHDVQLRQNCRRETTYDLVRLDGNITSGQCDWRSKGLSDPSPCRRSTWLCVGWGAFNRAWNPGKASQWRPHQSCQLWKRRAHMLNPRLQVIIFDRLEGLNLHKIYCEGWKKRGCWGAWWPSKVGIWSVSCWGFCLFSIIWAGRQSILVLISTQF